MATGQMHRHTRDPIRRQDYNFKHNIRSLRATDDAEIERLYPPPEWMQTRARRLWCDCIRSYEHGQFKRYNMPLLEQYILVYSNIQKLSRRLGWTSGLVKPTAIIDDKGVVTMVTKISEAYMLYRSLCVALRQLHVCLGMLPKNMMVTDTHDEEAVEAPYHDESRSGGPNRLRLIGGHKEVEIKEEVA